MLHIFSLKPYIMVLQHSLLWYVFTSCFSSILMNDIYVFSLREEKVSGFSLSL